MADRAQNINPAMLRWARETAGLPLEEAARRLGISASSNRLENLESGEGRPTRNQLLKMASVYRRPLTVFYRANPPEEAPRGEDFRTLDVDVPREEAARLDALLRDIRTRQEIARSLVEDDEDTNPLEFIGTLSIETDIQIAAAKIRDLLGTQTSGNLRWNERNSDELFSSLRASIERLGVFVILAADLGNHTSTISETVFRGFAIADEIAPFIVINHQDARAARSFTLIHEFTHLLIGSTGVSSAPSTLSPTTNARRLERFCNDVAGEFLLPSSMMPDIPNGLTGEPLRNRIAGIADMWRVSEPMVAYRLWRTKKISETSYRDLAAMYQARWREHRRRQKEASKEEGKRGPSTNVIRRHRLGEALLSLVSNGLRSNEITHTTAARILGVKPTSVEPLVRKKALSEAGY